ncbi:MAG TPA: hypothetical protein VNA21_06620 [Steroidobacteraceae bacterium]|nr:hypothetical protein [Steroidobacteraceae bacterium]
MNARASAIPQAPIPAPPIARAEHISLEAEADIAAPPTRPPHRKVRSTYVLKSGLRDCSTELSLLDDHYLQVHTQRARKESKKYSIDLRYLNSQPVRTRRIAWAWWSLSAALLLSTGAAMWLAVSSPALFTSSGFIIACVTSVATIGTTLLAVRHTTESLNFTSVHGGASLVHVIGGIGSTKAGKSFFVAMIKEIAAAKSARQQAKQQLLRDEMREHHRLRELGVLSELDYEASKARILRAYA